MNTFTFNGLCSEDFGLYITGEPYGGPQKDVSKIEIPAHSGDLIRSRKRFKNITIPYSVFLHDNIALDTRRVKSWLLCPEGYCRLADSYQRDYFRLAHFEGPIDFAQTLNLYAECVLNFDCKPFLYSYEGQEVHRITKPGDLINPEQFESEPYIKVYGNAPGSLYVGNTVVQLLEINGYVEIDSEIGQAFKGGIRVNDKVKGTLPILKRGRTTFQWDGGITHIDVIPRWCTP